MKLYYPGPGERRVVLPDSGHVAIVGQEPRELPPFMHAAAMAAGCLPEGVEKPQGLVEAPPARTDEALRAHLIAIADAAEPGTVDDEGRPFPDAVRARVGYHVTDTRVYQLWALIEQQVSEDEAPPPPPLVELSEQQVRAISELAQMSFRTLQEVAASPEADIVVLREVLAGEGRAAKPRTSVVALLTNAIAKLEAAK